MAFDFPSSPTFGQTFTPPGGPTYTWNGYGWGVGSSSAPLAAEYITSTVDATLTAERVLTDTATVTWDRTTAGQIKANAAGGGGASISISDTPPGSPTAGSMWWESDTGTLW